jgi:myo-inositol-1(or 4)-monophosphatase
MSEASSQTTQQVRLALAAVLDGARLTESATTREPIARKGSLRDLVTAVDVEIDHLLTRRFTEAGWAVCSEEQATPTPPPAAFWAIDPLDGTANFAHGLPQYAISAGWVERGRCRLGVVCAPALDELFFTLGPDRALRNGTPIVHVHRAPAEALVAASFPATAGDAAYALFHQVNESTQGCLRTGSAAVNLCYTAAGVLQGAYGVAAKVWDVAGGIAIAQAAGCEAQLHIHDDGLTVDYLVGSREVVAHVQRLAQAHGLWR